MPSNLQLYLKEHYHRWFSVNIFMWKYFFIASFHANMYLQMFYKIDVPENPAKLTGNWVYQTLLTPTQIFFWESFEIFRNTFFIEHLRTSASDFNSIFFYCFKTFCFRTDQYLYNIPSYFRVHQNPWSPGSLGPHTFST